jgi:hypothetical protein
METMEPISDPAWEAELKQELSRLSEALTRRWGRSGIAPLPSRWSGAVELAEDDENFGVFRPEGRIALNRSLMHRPDRWFTLLHELLHSYSAGGTAEEYSANRGWEEGPVESLLRLLIRDMLADIGEMFPEAAFRERSVGWVLNAYLPPMEAIRAAAGEEDPERFFLELLTVPIASRKQWLSLKLVRSGKREALPRIGRMDLLLRRNVLLPGATLSVTFGETNDE